MRVVKGNRKVVGDDIFSSDEDFGFEDITELIDEELSDCPNSIKDAKNKLMAARM